MTNQIQKQFKKQKNMRKITLLMLLAFVAMFTNAQIARYVKVSTTGTGDGTSWENAAGTADIQTQINAVAAETNQGTVYFAAGTYLISAQIQLKNNVQLMGGYAADGSGTRDLLNNQTILDGQFNKRILYTGDASPNVAFTKITKVDGFILQRGSSSYGSAAAISIGTVLENCIIRNNNGSTFGAAVFIKRHATISSPTNGWNQGAALVNCVIANNSSSSYAGAIFVNQDTHFSLVNCVVANNKSTDATATTGVGGLYWGTNVRFSRVSNNIFYNNTATSGKTNILLQVSNQVEAAVYNNYFSDAAFSDVDFTAANGNKLTGDIASPGFAAPTSFQGHDAAKMTEIVAADWRLSSTSGLIGLGSTASGRADIPYPYVATTFGGVARAYTTVTTDVQGSSRIINTTVEMGAYEYNPVIITTASANVSQGTVTAGVTVSKGSSVTVTATPEAGYKFTKWNNGTSDVSTSAAYTFVPAADVTMTAMFETDLGTGTKTPNQELAIRISGSNLTINGNGNLEIYNILGKRIANNQIRQEMTFRLDAGIYVVRLTTQEGKKVQKIKID
jgi:hypothetical protein